MPASIKNCSVKRLYYVVSLGCAKNLVDTEVMMGFLEKAGYVCTKDAQEAELIIVNTCGFLEDAVTEGVDCILELAQLKKHGKCRRLIVSGCMVERYRSKLKQELPEVDIFLSVDEFSKVALLENTSSECFEPARKASFLYNHSMPRIITTGAASAYVKIADGCNRTCAFCIIPKLRGNYRSRKKESVRKEVQSFLQKGIKEINLVAQDSTFYGKDLYKKNFGIEYLLREITKTCDNSHDYWLRLLYAYPTGVSDELLELLSSSPNICAYLDLPLQHISDSVLARMKRPLGGEKTKRLIYKIKEKFPNIKLRTTFLLGYPGETEQDVKMLECFVSEGLFTHVGVFAYSDEEEAGSFSLTNKYSKRVAEERCARVIEAQKAVVNKRNRAFLGTTVKVLIEGVHSETDLLLCARTEWQAPDTDGNVLINSISESLTSTVAKYGISAFMGCFADVTVTEFCDYDLIGEVNRIY